MDYASVTDADLDEILTAYGFDDARSYSRAEKEAILRNIQGDDNMGGDSSVGEPAPPLSPPIQAAFDATVNEDEVLNTAMREALDVGATSNAEMDLNVTEEAAQIVADAPTLGRNDSSGPPLTEEQELKVLNFVEVTGADTSYARSILASTEWDLDSAVTIFFASEGGFQPAQPPVRSAVTSRTIPPTGSHFYSSVMGGGIGGGGFEISGMGIGPRTEDGEGEEMTDAESMMRRHMQSLNEMVRIAQRMHMEGGGEDDGDDGDEDMTDSEAFRYFREHGVFPSGVNYPSSSSSAPRHQEVDEDGVRIHTDPIRMQRLISRQITDDENTHAMLGRADDPHVQWLVEPPRHLTYMGSFTHAKNKGTLENRWVLVNIQSHEQFASNELNRDTWVDETIVSILNNQYLFWQRGHTTPDAKEFMRLYRVTEAELPVIAIIEPNTGAKLAMRQGYMEPIDMAAWLIEFNEKHQRMPSPMKPSSVKDNGEVRKEEVTTDQDEMEVIEKVQENIAVAEQEVHKAKLDSVKEYGVPSTEPAENDPDMIKILIRLASGKRVSRRYRRQDPVRTLFAVVVQEDPASTTQPFDLTFAAGSAPAVSLLAKLDSTLEECQLKGTVVTYKKLVCIAMDEHTSRMMKDVQIVMDTFVDAECDASQQVFHESCKAQAYQAFQIAAAQVLSVSIICADFTRRSVVNANDVCYAVDYLRRNRIHDLINVGLDQISVESDLDRAFSEDSEYLDENMDVDEEDVDCEDDDEDGTESEKCSDDDSEDSSATCRMIDDISETSKDIGRNPVKCINGYYIILRPEFKTRLFPYFDRLLYAMKPFFRLTEKACFVLETVFKLLVLQDKVSFAALPPTIIAELKMILRTASSIGKDYRELQASSIQTAETQLRNANQHIKELKKKLNEAKQEQEKTKMTLDFMVEAYEAEQAAKSKDESNDDAEKDSEDSSSPESFW